MTLAPGDSSMMVSGLVFGDSNGDNTINVYDFTVLASSFGLSMSDPDYVEPADNDSDGTISINDFTAVSLGLALAALRALVNNSFTLICYISPDVCQCTGGGAGFLAWMFFCIDFQTVVNHKDALKSLTVNKNHLRRRSSSILVLSLLF